MKETQTELETLKEENKALAVAISKRDAMIRELTEQLAVKGYPKLSCEILKKYDVSFPTSFRSSNSYVS